MRNILLIITMSLSISMAAQNFTITPSLSFTSNQSLNTYVDYTFYIKNKKASVLNLSWDLVSDNFLAGWDYSICDFGTCYLKPFPSSATMAPIAVGDSGFMKMTLGTATFAGNGVFKIFVYETGNKAGGDTLTWDITAGTTGFASSLNTNSVIELYPNPVIDKAFVSFKDAKSSKVLMVYNCNGALVKQVKVEEGVVNAELNLSELSAGTYFLTSTEENNTYIKKFLVQ